MENEEGKKEVIIKEKEVIKEIHKKDGKLLSKPIKLVLLIILISVLLGGGIFGISFGINRIFETQEKILKLGFEDVGELVTQTCHTVVLEDSRESRTFFDLFEIPFTESRQIFSYDFDVDASVDFSKMEIKNIDDTKKEVTIKTVHSKVFKTVLQPDTFKVYLDSDGLFSRIDLSEHNEALIKMEELAEDQCLAGKLLENADSNAERLLTAMVKSNDKYKEYIVTFDYYEEKLETNNE